MTYPPQQPNPWNPQPQQPPMPPSQTPGGFPAPSNPYHAPPPSQSPYGPQNPYSAPPGQNPYAPPGQQQMPPAHPYQPGYVPGFAPQPQKRAWGVVAIGAAIFTVGLLICVLAVVNNWGVIWWGLPLWGLIMMVRGFLSRS